MRTSKVSLQPASNADAGSHVESAAGQSTHFDQIFCASLIHALCKQSRDNIMYVKARELQITSLGISAMHLCSYTLHLIVLLLNISVLAFASMSLGQDTAFAVLADPFPDPRHRPTGATTKQCIPHAAARDPTHYRIR